MMVVINEDEIRKMAYRLWEEEGRPEGKAEEHWSRAAMAVADQPHRAGESDVAAKSARPVKVKGKTKTASRVRKATQRRSSKAGPKA